MKIDILVKQFEHNNWANIKLLEVCSSLTEEQLDATPRSVTVGNIRKTAMHLVGAQRGYFSLLSGVSPEERKKFSPPTSKEWMEVLHASGEGLLALLLEGSGYDFDKKLQTLDGYSVEPWVVFVQVIDHADEHREQIKSMLNDLGVKPPDLDSWTMGEEQGALVPPKSKTL